MVRLIECVLSGQSGVVSEHTNLEPLSADRDPAGNLRLEGICIFFHDIGISGDNASIRVTS